MNTSIVFFGTLRSTKLLKIILNKNIKNNQFIKCVIRGSKLKKIYNEVYPCLLKTNNSAIIPSEKNCTDKRTKRIPKKNSGLRRLRPCIFP